MDESNAPLSPDPALQHAEEPRLQPAPDPAEQDLAEVVDDAVPSRSYEMLPMVGLGGSAGSIAVVRWMIWASTLSCSADRCMTTTKTMPLSAGAARK